MQTKSDTSTVVTSVRRAFVNFPHVKAIVAALDRLLTYRRERAEPLHLLIVGESGVGKSTLLKHYVAAHPRIEHEEYTEIPVLFASLDEAPTPKTLSGKLLLSMGSPFWNKGTAEERRDQLLRLLDACKVQLVILDEANHLVDRGGEKTLHTSADWIKNVADASGIPFVLAGIPRTKRLLDTNDQLRGRFREVISVERFSVADSAEEIRFRSVLKSFQRLLSGIDSIDLSSREIARAFAFATDGRLREIRSLLVRSVELALASTTSKLTMAVLAEAFASVIYPKAPVDRNPFHEKFKAVPLTGPSEPFAPVER